MKKKTRLASFPFCFDGHNDDAYVKATIFIFIFISFHLLGSFVFRNLFGFVLHDFPFNLILHYFLSADFNCHIN